MDIQRLIWCTVENGSESFDKFFSCLQYFSYLDHSKKTWILFQKIEIFMLNSRRTDVFDPLLIYILYLSIKCNLIMNGASVFPF